MTKVVMVKTEAGTPVMLVLPATHKVGFARLPEVLGTCAEPEQEREFRDLFPGCEIGAEPPLGKASTSTSGRLVYAVSLVARTSPASVRFAKRGHSFLLLLDSSK
jgi:hypothetical protein